MPRANQQVGSGQNMGGGTSVHGAASHSPISNAVGAQGNVCSGNPSSAPVISDFASDPEMHGLVETFASELPARGRAMSKALSSADVGAIRWLAHQLKGACAGYGFAQIGEVAERVESTLLNENIDAEAALEAVRSTVTELVQLCERSRAS